MNRLLAITVFLLAAPFACADSVIQFNAAHRYEVYVDGEFVGNTPCVKDDVWPGDYSVEFRPRGRGVGKSYQIEVSDQMEYRLYLDRLGRMRYSRGARFRYNYLQAPVIIYVPQHPALRRPLPHRNQYRQDYNFRDPKRIHPHRRHP